MSNEESNALHKLLLSGRYYKYKKGQIVNSSEDRLNLTLVKSGYVMRYIITNNGSPSVQSIYGPGYFYPLTRVFQLLFKQEIYKGPEVIYYETLEDTELYTIDSDVFLSSLEKDPAIYKDILYEAGKRFFSNIQRLENRSLSSSTQQVAHQLYFYATEFGKEKADKSVKISLPFTHNLLGSILSLTRETVSQSMGELRKLKLIKTSYHSITIPNLAALKDFAYA